MTATYYSSVQDVATVDSDPAFKSSQFGEVGEGIPLLRGENIEPGALRWSKTRTWPESLLPGYEHLLVEKGDLILGMDRPVISTGLKLAAARASDLPALLVQRVARIRPRSIDGRYLYLWLTSEEFIQHLQGSATGTQLPHVNLASIREFQVPRFDEDVERRIIDILEDHLSRLDAADQGIALSLAKLNGLRERTLIHALTSEDVGERAAANLPEVGTFDGDLPSLPVGWDWARLGDVAEVVGGITKDANKQSDPSFVEVPYLRVANVQRGHLNLDVVTQIRADPPKAKSLRLEAGDVLLNEGGDRDKLARGWVWEGQIPECIHQNHVFRARLHEPRLDPYFLSWTGNTFGGRWAERNGKQSVNLASISLRMIKQMPVIVPAAGDAEKVVASLRDQLDSYARLGSSLKSARERGAALRRSLLAAAFSGRLTASRDDQEKASANV